MPTRPLNTPRTKRQEQAAARREQLVHTAMRLFAERGYRDTSVRDIARAAEVNEALLYHYFANKADLFRAVLAEYAPFRAVEAFRTAAVGPAASRSLHDALLAFGRDFLARLREHRAFVVAMLTESAHDTELGAILGEFLSTTGDEITQLLAAYQEAGQIDPHLPLAVASRILQGSLLFQFLTNALRAPSSPEADDALLGDLVGVLLAGLLPR